MNDIIFLDLDGVLINTFPVWKSDEMDTDGYSKFNQVCTDNFIKLLDANPKVRIVVSSSRRIGKSMERLESIFSFRGMANKIIDKIPDPIETHLSREIEISNYIQNEKVKNFLILDDDVSLLNLSEEHAEKLVLTKYRDGFNEKCLKKAYSIINNWS